MARAVLRWQTSLDPVLLDVEVPDSGASRCAANCTPARGIPIVMVTAQIDNYDMVRGFRQALTIT
jgi:DNA-binding response OmpR family regulator